VKTQIPNTPRKPYLETGKGSLTDWLVAVGGAGAGTLIAGAMLSPTNLFPLCGIGGVPFTLIFLPFSLRTRIIISAVYAIFIMSLLAPYFYLTN
jgi:hypothetical protein